MINTVFWINDYDKEQKKESLYAYVEATLIGHNIQFQTL